MRVKGHTKLHVKLHTESCAKLIAFMHVKGHAKRQRIKCKIACKIEIAGLFLHYQHTLGLSPLLFHCWTVHDGSWRNNDRYHYPEDPHF